MHDLMDLPIQKSPRAKFQIGLRQCVEGVFDIRVTMHNVRQKFVGHVLTGAAVLLLGTVVMPVSPASAQIVLSTIKVGNWPSAIAVDPAGTFAYVTNSDSGSVSKINLATNTVIATIKVGDQPSAIAVNPAGTFAYVTYRISDSVSKINLATGVSNATVTMPASAKVLAAYANLTVAKGATISLRVAPSSATFCKVSRATLNVINSGSCKVRVTVKPKVGKSVSKTVTLDVTK